MMNLTATEEFSETFEFYVEGLLLMVVAIVGIIGNVLFILLFSCHANKINTFHSLMVSLAWADCPVEGIVTESLNKTLRIL